MTFLKFPCRRSDGLLVADVVSMSRSLDSYVAVLAVAPGVDGIWNC